MLLFSGAFGCRQKKFSCNIFTWGWALGQLALPKLGQCLAMSHLSDNAFILKGYPIKIRHHKQATLTNIKCCTSTYYVYNLMKFNYYLCNYLKCKFDDLFVNRIIVFNFHILIYVKIM
jgi:hypothetical protein